MITATHTHTHTQSYIIAVVAVLLLLLESLLPDGGELRLLRLLRLLLLLLLDVVRQLQERRSRRRLGNHSTLCSLLRHFLSSSVPSQRLTLACDSKKYRQYP